jgi:hypothetical protein
MDRWAKNEEKVGGAITSRATYQSARYLCKVYEGAYADADARSYLIRGGVPTQNY